ncbi:c-type cytochrome [Sandaracinus amylolyticus]|uniref:Methylamine utilization protein mauG n=1 Tax=Sandaracinus amylolyticus TaxID=927083 RepID=A0A0F6YGP4_9BACT|nr:c-type cytochrome [Sandaracinus amylolyticus]AKF04938.1 Methylamine utilization protein mauG [Sandaracinus amylolyticus]
MRRALAIVLVLAACGAPRVEPDAAVVQDASTPIDAPVELRALAGASRYALVGDEVVLDGSASTGATRYQWAPGGGLAPGPISEDPVLRVRYAAPGREQAVLTVWDASGRRRSAGVVISVTRPPTHVPRQSSSIALVGDHLVAAVSPDSDEVVLARWSDDATLEVVRRARVCDEPRTLAPWRGRVIVACTGDAVALVELERDAVQQVALPRGSRPFGVVGTDGSAWVSLQATGMLAEITLEDASLRLARSIRAIDDARGVSVLPDGRIAVTRWRSPDEHGEIAAVDVTSADVETWTLAYDPQPSSDTEVGGVPSYLEQLLVSPDATTAMVPSLQAAIGEGLFVTGGARPLTFETTMRAVISFLDPASGVEDVERRRQLDNRGFTHAGVLSSRGDYLFALTRGTRTVERIDVLETRLAGSIQDVGLAPNGLALSPDDRFLFVDAYLSREIVIYDVRDFDVEPSALARVRIPTSEPLSDVLLRGKILFNDSRDPRLSSDGYIACAHCHLDGLDDRRVWDFTDRGEGLRNTTSLLGFPTTGAIHWTANFDEVQDFEHDIRGPFRGAGLMDDASFHTGTRDTTLGDRKSGISADLDALAAYVASLATFAPSPFRAPDGSLPEAAERGRVLFESSATGCADCHAGDRMTDSGFDEDGSPRLHDVGTLGAGSGQRLGAALPGLDTPTLHGVWSTAPYLHDGSAATLREVLRDRNPGDAHGRTAALGDADIDDLVAYLRCLDGRRD